MAAKKGKKKAATRKSAADKVQEAPEIEVSETPTDAGGEMPEVRALGPAWLAAMLVVVGLGLAFAIYLAHLHVVANYGAGTADAICDVNSGLNCTTVAKSSWSLLLGIPQAVWGIAGYLLMAFFAVAAWHRGRESAEMALLFGLGVIASTYGIFLLMIATFAIKAHCLFCIGMDLANIIVAVLAWTSAHGSLAELTKRGLRGLRPTGTIIAGAAVFFVGLSISYGAYYSAKEKAAAATAERLTSGGQPNTGLPGPTDGKPGQRLPEMVTQLDPSTGKSRPVRLKADRVTIEIPDDAPDLGPEDAKVTIVEFSDFQCPYCKKLAHNLHRLHDEHPEDVRLVFMHFPMKKSCNDADIAKSMHANACTAAVASICAHRQDKFWEFHDLLFQRSSRLGGKEYSRLARRAGLDFDAFVECYEDPATMERARADTVVGGALGITGTPAFFVNGRMMRGGQPMEVLDKVLEAELEGVEGALAFDVVVGAERVGQVEDVPTTVSVEHGRYPFQIDAFEAAVEDGMAASRPGLEVARGLNWYQARDACGAAGKRLCTEEEWLMACTGAREIDDNRNGEYSDDLVLGLEYAYGKYYDSGACADGRSKDNPDPLLAGHHPDCRTPSGIYDMHGNVKEWVGLTPDHAGVKGGSYFSGESARCAYWRDDVAPDKVDESVGARCCSGELPEELRVDVDRFHGGKVGDTLAAFSGTLLAGGRFSSESLTGKPVIIAFWASWCAPCKEEMPFLNELYATYHAQGLTVLGINVDEDPQKAKDWLAEHPMGFPILGDKDEILRLQFDAPALPATFWVRPDGHIRLRTTGIPSGGEKKLDELARDLLVE